MATTKRKLRRRGILLERAAQTDTLRAQVERLQAQLASEQQARRSADVEAAALSKQLAEASARNAVLVAQAATQRIRHADAIQRFEVALRDRGDHIEQLIAEREALQRRLRFAGAARDTANARYEALKAEDRDTLKLRRRLREAKETIVKQQTELNRRRRQDKVA